MKKIVTAHLGNKVFQIEDDAYAYLNKFLSYHKDDHGIETQIATMLTNKLTLEKKVITYPDVIDVLYQLGFSASEMQQEYQEQSHKEKKLYKNTENKRIAGVCSGLADYFDADPTLVRVIFLAAFFFGGFGFLTYLALWIVMPKK